MPNRNNWTVLSNPPCAVRKCGASCSAKPAGGLRPRRVAHASRTRTADDWIINGQKIWTSGAHLSDFGIIVVRTDPKRAET